MIIDEVKEKCNKQITGKKSYIAGTGLLARQQQNSKGEADLTKKEILIQFRRLESSRSKIVLVHLLIRHLFLVCRTLSSSCVFTLSFLFPYVCQKEEVWPGKKTEGIRTERKEREGKRS